MLFCKQKTAYEIRISDWSSDVCSSDLLHIQYPGLRFYGASAGPAPLPGGPSGESALSDSGGGIVRRALDRQGCHRAGQGNHACRARLEEHTSELPSLMRISYAVLCLINKTHSMTKTTNSREKIDN